MKAGIIAAIIGAIGVVHSLDCHKGASESYARGGYKNDFYDIQCVIADVPTLPFDLFVLPLSLLNASFPAFFPLTSLRLFNNSQAVVISGTVIVWFFLGALLGWRYDRRKQKQLRRNRPVEP